MYKKSRQCCLSVRVHENESGLMHLCVFMVVRVYMCACIVCVCVYVCVQVCVPCVCVCMCHLGNCSFQRLVPLPHFNTHLISLWSWRLVGTWREQIINYVHKSHHVSTEFGLTQEWKKLVTFWSLCGDIGLLKIDTDQSKHCPQISFSCVLSTFGYHGNMPTKAT